MGLTIADGKEFVKAARRSIEYFMHTGSPLKEAPPKKKYSEKLGVFVSLHTYPEHELRGCIGYPEPVAQLWSALLDSAVSAAFRDPRFPQLEAQELNKIVVEVSVLTKPELAEAKNRDELPSKIKIGKDGLVVKMEHRKGLLLPQVAPEFGWSASEFLQHACLKAGLNPKAWCDSNCGVYKFQAQVFREKKPKGGVEEVKQ